MDNSLKDNYSAGGFAAWENRIAPLFDTADQLVFVGVESGRIVRESREEIPREAQIQKVLRLVDLGVGVLVCGAISRQLFNMISSYGIQVLPFIAGELSEVIQAWLQGKLESDLFAMPGCCGRAGRRFGYTIDSNLEVMQMNVGGRGMGGGGRGMGGGRGAGGRGMGGGGRGMGGGGRGGVWPAERIGISAFCFCPQCGHREPHEPGLPCMQKKCPKCGVTLNKE